MCLCWWVLGLGVVLVLGWFGVVLCLGCYGLLAWDRPIGTGLRGI